MTSRQTSKTKRRFLLIPTVIALGAVLLLFGCSSDETTAPTDLDRSAIGATQMIDRGIAGSEQQMFSKMVGKRGGVVFHDDVMLAFPPRSLPGDIEITIIKQPSDPDKIVFELLPHGIEFNKEVTLRVNLLETGLRPGEEGTIYWFDPEKGEWVDLEADFRWPIATVKLEHFSKYGGGGRGGW